MLQNEVVLERAAMNNFRVAVIRSKSARRACEASNFPEADFWPMTLHSRCGSLKLRVIEEETVDIPTLGYQPG